MVFPVDQIVNAQKPLHSYFGNDTDTASNKNFHLEIHNFYISYNESMFKRYLKLNACIGLSEINKRNSYTTISPGCIFKFGKEEKN